MLIYKEGACSVEAGRLFSRGWVLVYEEGACSVEAERLFS